jgi:kelch-like protein 30
VADPPTLVPVEGEWCKPLRSAREAGEFIDLTLLVGGRQVPTHKVAIVSHSPYLHGLLTSGLAESNQGGDTLKIGDDSTDGRAVEAIVDCFYSGQLSLSQGTVSSVIRTANLLGVGAVEKAACDFFVESLEPSTACEALGFAAAHSECGEHARGLHERCVEYVVDHFAECSAEPAFLELCCDAVAEVIGSDDLPVEEAAVVSAVRAWFEKDTAGRQESLKALVPLVRWPLLPVDAQLQLSKEPLLVRMMEQDRQALALGVELVTECIPHFAGSDAAAECPRLKQRKGTVLPVLPLAFTVLSQEHYATSEGGALLTVTANPRNRPALCGERVMSSGQSCAEVTVVQAGGMMIGVGRPTLNLNVQYAYNTADFWGVCSTGGDLFHNGTVQGWQGMQRYGPGDVLRLLLDSDAGTLTVKKNGTLLGVAVTSGLTGDLCWAMACYGEGDSVRIKAVDPAEF